MILTNNLKIRGVEITPFNGDPKEQVSVDLTVGSLYQRSSDPDWLHVNEALTIHPGTCLIIQTAESIKMPNNAFGLLATKGSIGAKGAITANTKLDPLFDGNLNIPIFNAGDRKIELKKGQSFCSISFWTTESPVVGNTTRNAIKVQPRTTSKLKDFLDRNFVHIITASISLVGSIGAALITIYLKGGAQ
jgi:deoxycytidine triphosphate deaminase